MQETQNDYQVYLTDRREKMVELVGGLRQSSDRISQFLASPNEIAKEHGLVLSSDEASQITEIATASFMSDGLEGDPFNSWDAQQFTNISACTPTPNDNCT